MKKLFFFLVATTVASAQGPNAKAIVAEAKAEAAKNNHSRAVVLYSKALFYEPANAETYYQRAISYDEMQDNAHTLEDYNKAIELDPTFTAAYISRGFMCTYIGNADAAMADCQKGLANVKENQTDMKNMLILLRGVSLSMQKQYDAAIPDLQHAVDNIKLDNIKAQAIHTIAKVYSAQQKHDKAIAHLERLVKEYPTMPEIFQQLAFEYGEIGQYQKAVDVNDKALDVENNIKRNEKGEIQVMDRFKFNDTGNNRIALIYNNRGFAKHKLGNNPEAMADIEKSIGLYPDNSYAYRNRALVNLALNDKKAACNDLNKSLELGFTKAYGDEVAKLRETHCK